MKIKELTGQRIKELRHSMKMSQEALAEKVGISSKYLSSIERGKENPTFDTFINLCNALNVELEALFDFSHKGKSAKELKFDIANLIKTGTEEKLELTMKIVKAIYL